MPGNGSRMRSRSSSRGRPALDRRNAPVGFGVGPIGRRNRLSIKAGLGAISGSGLLPAGMILDVGMCSGWLARLR